MAMVFIFVAFNGRRDLVAKHPVVCVKNKTLFNALV